MVDLVELKQYAPDIPWSSGFRTSVFRVLGFCVLLRFSGLGFRALGHYGFGV